MSTLIKIISIAFLVLLIILASLVIYLFSGRVPKTENPEFGIVFSQKHARDLGLNWKITYRSLLRDLKVKKIKIVTHWDLLEPEENNYYFKDLDWQLTEADKKGAEVILVIGMKTGRWPECHLPNWAKELSEKEQKKRVIELVQILTTRYKESDPVVAWSVENEPFFTFGDCPWEDEEVLKKEIAMVRKVDSYYDRPIMITDSGESSLWLKAAQFGDILGVTMYREVWMTDLEKYFTFPFPPFYYWKKKEIINNLYDKEVVCSELQAEPWCPSLLYNCSLEEQSKTMDIDKFKESIEFAKQTGFDEFYLWGSEWWYWMRKEQDRPQIWNEAKKLF